MKDQGYTLIELLVVMVIIMGILVVSSLFVGGCVYLMYTQMSAPAPVPEETEKPPGIKGDYMGFVERSYDGFAAEFGVSVAELKEIVSAQGVDDSIPTIIHHGPDSKITPQYTIWHDGECWAWGDFPNNRMQYLAEHIETLLEIVTPGEKMFYYIVERDSGGSYDVTHLNRVIEERGLDIRIQSPK